MATFWTVEEDGDGNPKEVQSDLATLTQDIDDPLMAVYVYVGKKGDDGWKIAKTACALFAMTKPWLVSDVAALRAWIPVGSPKGVVFGFDGEPDNLLSEAEVVILKIVRNALTNAI